MNLTIYIANQDITDEFHIDGCSVSERGTDFPLALEMQPSAAHVRINDTSANFSKQNPSNFFVSNS